MIDFSKLKGIPILDVITEYVQMRKMGSNYKGLCPFHDEKTPSFVVSPRRNTFKCFGCGEQGDAVDFIARVTNVDLPTAARAIANRYGISIEEQEDKVQAVIDKWQQYFIDHRETAQQYLADRGLAADDWGYCPDDVDWEIRNRASRDAGLLSASGKLLFRGRITIPIRDRSGQIISFAGRALGERVPKYVNGMDSQKYTKSTALFGIEHITPGERVTVVEGYTDVIAIRARGRRQAVATCGTALTEGHVSVLRRLGGPVTLCFDGDPAGIKAMARGIRQCLAGGITPDVILLPPGEDPASLGGDFDGDANFADFILSARDGSMATERVIISQLAHLSLFFIDSLEKSMYIAHIARVTGIPIRALKEKIRENDRTNNHTAGIQAEARPQEGDGAAGLEDLLKNARVRLQESRPAPVEVRDGSNS